MKNLLAVLMCTVLAPAALAGDAPVLKPEAAVAGAVVALGDLVDNAGALAARPVFRAPDPGQTGRVSAARIVAAAERLGLRLDAGGLAEVAVTRLARVITATEIEAALRRELQAHLHAAEPEELQVSLDEPIGAVAAEAGSTGALKLAKLDHVPGTGRFSAVFTVPGAASTKPLRITGTAVEMVETVVLTRTLARGEAVREADITVQRVPRSALGQHAATGLSDVLERVAKRMLRAGESIRPGDVERPQLVARGEMVTLVFRRPGLVLSVRGRALQPGSSGDMVSILNLQSKRTVQGTVTGAGTVEIPGAAVLTSRSLARS